MSKLPKGKETSVKKPKWETPEEFEAWRRAESAKILKRLRGVRRRAWDSYDDESSSEDKVTETSFEEWYQNRVQEAVKEGLELQRLSDHDPWGEEWWDRYNSIPWWKYKKLEFGPNGQQLMPLPLFGLLLVLVTAIIGIPLGMLSWWFF